MSSGDRSALQQGHDAKIFNHLFGFGDTPGSLPPFDGTHVGVSRLERVTEEPLPQSENVPDGPPFTVELPSWLAMPTPESPPTASEMASEFFVAATPPSERGKFDRRLLGPGRREAGAQEVVSAFGSAFPNTALPTFGHGRSAFVTKPSESLHPDSDSVDNFLVTSTPSHGGNLGAGSSSQRARDLVLAQEIADQQARNLSGTEDTSSGKVGQGSRVDAYLERVSPGLRAKHHAYMGQKFREEKLALEEAHEEGGQGTAALEEITPELQAAYDDYAAWVASVKQAEELADQAFKGKYATKMAALREKRAAKLWEAEAKKSRELEEQGRELQRARDATRTTQQRRIEANRQQALRRREASKKRKEVEELAQIMAEELERLSQEGKHGAQM